MARTRRQAAHLPSSPSSPSSSSESDIPAAATRRAKPDPYDIATLRPSREGHPKLFLRTNKRGAVAAQLGSQSPSEAKRRRRESAVASSSPKRGRESAADRVDPNVIRSLNDFSKKARGMQDARGPQMRRITVELKQSSARSSAARTVSEAPGDGEDDEQEEEEAEPESSPAASNFETTQGSTTKQSHHPPPQVSLTGNSEPDAAELPPRSGQGGLPPATQPEASSQRTSRKSQTRKPKVAFNERPQVEEPAQRASRSASAVPRTSEQTRPATEEPVSVGRHPKQVAGHHLPSTTQTNAIESFFVDDDESEANEGEEADEAEEEDSDHDDAQDVDSRPAPSTAASQLTVHVRSEDVRSMSSLMGRKSWTAYGKRWAEDISHPAALKNEGLPATKFGQSILQLVVFLRSILKIAPEVRHVAMQNTFLQEKQKKTEKAILEITRFVDNICTRYKAVEGGKSRKEAREQADLQKDLIQCIIPLLVLLLREFFFLGGNSLDTEGDREPPQKGGDFTSTTLELLSRTTGWIRRLAAIVRRESELDDFSPSSDEEEEDPKSPAAKKQHTSVRRRRFEERAKQRIALEEIARQLNRTITKASAQLEEEIDKEARRKARMERAEEVKAEREREERDARVKSQRRWEAMCVSTQRLRDGLGPVSSMWVKAQQLEEKIAEERQRELAERERFGSPLLGGFFDEPPVRAHHRSRNEESLFPREDRSAAAAEAHVPTGKLWTEVESQWLLGKLKEGIHHDYDSWAEALGRRVDEVRQEAHLLKVAATSLAKDQRKAPPAWTQF